MAMEPSQDDIIASDAALVYDKLNRIEKALDTGRFGPKEQSELRQATSIAYSLMVNTDGTATFMRALFRLARRRKLDRNIIAQFRAFERAFPQALGPTDNECSPSYSGMPDEDEHQQAVPVMAHPDFHHNSY